MPKLLSVCQKAIKSFKKLLLLLNRDGKEAFHHNIFKTASEILEQLSNEEDDIIPECQTRAAAADNPYNDFWEFHGHFLTGSLDNTMEINLKEFKTIAESLIKALKSCLEPPLENEGFKAICIILGSESYPFLSVDIIYDEIKVIVEHFKSLLLANNCSIDHLKDELEVLHDHMIRYVSKSSSERCQRIIFHIGHDLGIHNLLHVLEICLTVPLSNAESDRVFIFVVHFFQGTTINEE